MGSHHANICQDTDDSIICNCFRDDPLIQNRGVVYDIPEKWIWSEEHNSMLTKSLSNNAYQFPEALISLIKDLSFSVDHNYYISKPHICSARYYAKTKDLLNKTLCRKWYLDFMNHSLSRCFTIALINTSPFSAAKGHRILDYFAVRSRYLPLLELQPQLKYTQARESNIKRTVHLDCCRMSVHLINMDLHQVSQSKSGSAKAVHVHMFLLDGDTDITAVNHKIQSMQSSIQCGTKACVLVQTDPKRKRSHIQIAQQCQLSRQYNISCFELSLKSDASMHDLFVFGIKYYWFCNAK